MLRCTECVRRVHSIDLKPPMGWELLLTQFSSCSIACGTDVSATNFIRKTVIYLADIKDRNFDGTPLHSSAYQSNKKIAELLIDKGADVNAKNKYGHTPLDRAERVYDRHSPKVKADKKETIDLLSKHGGKTGEEWKVEGK